MIKQDFIQTVAVSVLLYGCTTWMLIRRIKKKLDGNYTRMLRAILNKSWKQHPHEATAERPLSSHLKNHPNQTCSTLLEKQGRTHKWRSSMEPFHIDVPVFADKPIAYLHQVCMDSGCYLEDLPRVMDDRDIWREWVRDICVFSTASIIKICVYV